MAIACSPATPAPSTSTCAGGIVPAAVMSIGKKRGELGRRRSAPRGSRRPSPGEDSASIDCAREMRGIVSIASAVAPVAAIASRPVRVRRAGSRKPTSIVPGLSLRHLRGRRRRDLGDHLGAPRVAERGARSVYAASGAPARAPAPGSTTTSCSAATSRRTTSGTTATRRSRAAVSLGTPICKGGNDTSWGCRSLWKSSSHRPAPASPAGRRRSSAGRTTCCATRWARTAPARRARPPGVPVPPAAARRGPCDRGDARASAARSPRTRPAPAATAGRCTSRCGSTRPTASPARSCGAERKQGRRAGVMDL